MNGGASASFDRRCWRSRKLLRELRWRPRVSSARRRDRNDYPKSRSPADGRTDREAVSEYLRGALSDPQSEADAFTLGVEPPETLEYRVDPVFGDADPGVVDLDPCLGAASTTTHED